MEKTAAPTLFFKLLPEEAVAKISTYCDDSTFTKFCNVTSKEAGKAVQVAMANSIQSTVAQPVYAWKRLNKNSAKQVTGIFQNEKHIVELLEQINEQIKTSVGAKRFYQWIKVFGLAYTESYEFENSHFKTNEHQVLYYLISGKIANATKQIFELVKNEELKKKYPSVVKSLNKTYLLICLEKNFSIDAEAKKYIHQIGKLDADRTDPMFFFNLSFTTNIAGLLESIKNCSSQFARQIDFNGAMALSEAPLAGLNFDKARFIDAILDGADLTKAILIEANLSGACLANAILSEAKLSKAVLKNTILSKANLAKADLSKSVLTGADLSEANLDKAELFGAYLGKANLSRANLSEASLVGVDFSYTNLSEANLSKADLIGVALRRVNLRNANLTLAKLIGVNLAEVNDLRGANFSEADLTGVNLKNRYLSEIYLVKAILVRANFSEAMLPKADLSETDLSYSCFIYANLRGASLSRADLTRANFSYANLSDVNLTEADITANLIRANLSNANLTRAKLVADLRDANLSGVIFSEVDFSRARLEGASFYRTKLSTIQFRYAHREEADLRGVDLSGLDLSGLDLSGVNLTGAILNESDLTETNLAEANLSQANLTGAKLTGANLDRAKLVGAILAEADFSEATFIEADLAQANLGKANFTDANLGKAKLTEATLVEANLSRAILVEAELVKANLSGANLSRANFSKAILTEADLRVAKLAETDFSYANLDSLQSHDQINFNGANLAGVILSSDQLQSIKLANWLFIEKEIQQADANELRLIYNASSCIGNLWDKKRNPKFDLVPSLFKKMVHSQKLMTESRKKLNEAIINQARQLMATASSEVESQLNNLVDTLIASRLENNVISDGIELSPIADSTPLIPKL